MRNRYFRLLKSRELDKENKNFKKRNAGASLVYVLVILSIISAFSINFVYYVQQKKEMVFLKSSKENKIMYFLRSVYYKLIKKMSTEDQIEHFTGFGLYDKSFIEILRNLNDPIPFLRGLVAEYAPDHLEIKYEQQLRKAGRSSNNFFSLYDAAMLSFTSYTKGGLRIATFFGFTVSLISFLIAIVYLVLKFLFWDVFIAGNIPILMGVFFFGGLQLFFIGLLGEYIISMNTRIMNRPLVIEEERINF